MKFLRILFAIPLFLFGFFGCIGLLTDSRDWDIVRVTFLCVSGLLIYCAIDLFRSYRHNRKPPNTEVLAAEDQPKGQLVKTACTVGNLSPKVQFRQIKKNSKVFYKVKYRSGIPDREKGFFKNGSFHIATTPSGIVFIDPDSLKIAYLLLWRHLIGISSANEMGHATQNLLVGVAARSRTITGTIATAVAANMLQKKALIFQFRQIDGDRFIQEAIFEDSRNKKIRTAIMAARSKMIAQATR